MNTRPIALAWLLCGLGLAAPALAAEGPLKVDAATQRKLGVVVAPLAAARRSPTVDGFARVLDPSPLAILDSDIAVAAASAQASAAEAARTRTLFAADATVSAKAAEAAAAQSRGDAARLALLRRRLGLEWGPGISRLSDAARGRVVAALASGQSALVRIDSAQLPPGVRSARIDLGPFGTANAVVLGPARTGDPRLQSTGLIAQVSGPAAARLGAGMTAAVKMDTGAGAAGVVLPRSSLLRVDGRTLVYVRRPDGDFEQRLAEGVADPAGLFASRGFRPGEQVAVQGGMALYAAQNPPAAEED